MAPDRITCPTEHQLAAFIEDRLPAAQRSALLQHADGCPACSEVVAELAKTSHDGAAEPMDEAPPIRIDRYLVQGLLGAGNMGLVYSAHDTQLNRPVALKLLRPGDASPERDARQARLLREAQAMARLTHPNVLTIYDVGTTGAAVFLAMELCPGGTLAEWLHAAARPWSEVLARFLDAGRGLQAAHEVGLLHRDFKPDNVLVGRDGRVRVADFGLARLTDHADQVSPSAAGDLSRHVGSLTRTGATIGTPAYMAPEQLRGQAIGPRVDQFSFCTALFEALYNVRPYAGGTIAELLAAMEAGQLAPPPRQSQVPKRLRATLVRGLAAAPAARYPSMKVLLAALSSLAPMSARARRRGWLAAALIPLAVGGGALLHRVASRSPLVVAGAHRRQAVAVLDLRDRADRGDEGWLGVALREQLQAELAAGEELRLLTGEATLRARADTAIPAGLIADEALRRLRAYLGADVVLSGDYQADKERVDLVLRLQSTEPPRTLLTLHERAPIGELGGLVNRAGARLRAALGAGPLSAVEVAAVAATLPQDPAALRHYGQGLTQLRRRDLQGARAQLLLAAAVPPEHAMIHAALAQTLAQLGYDKEARVHAGRAFALSGSLLREQRLFIEGLYREVEKDRDKAIELYRALWLFFPDHLDYGLRLVLAQASAQRGPEAQTTLAALRRLPPPDRDDPRIDLAEAKAANTVSDFKRQQEAAARAVARGRQQGARLMVAEGLYWQGLAADSLGHQDQGRALVTEARGLYQKEGDATAEAWAVIFLAGDTERRGDLVGKLALLDEAEVLFRRSGNHHGEITVLQHRATTLRRQGRNAEARVLQEQILVVARQTGDARLTYQTLVNVANLDREDGDLAGAQRSYEEALVLARQGGDPYSEGMILLNFGDLLHARDDLPRARRTAAEAVALFERMGKVDDLGDSSVILAEIHLSAGHPAEAERLLRKVLLVLGGPADMDVEAPACTVLARALFLQSQGPAALAMMKRAEELAARSQDRRIKLATTIAAARLRAALAGGAERAAARGAAKEALQAALVAGFREIGHRARLVVGEIALREGDTARGRAGLLHLAQDARAQGLLLLAREATSLSKGSR